MGWERRQRGDQVKGYFYRSVRIPGYRYPVKIYYGRGAKAETIIHQIAADQAHQANINAQRREQAAHFSTLVTLSRLMIQLSSVFFNQCHPPLGQPETAEFRSDPMTENQQPDPIETNQPTVDPKTLSKKEQAKLKRAATRAANKLYWRDKIFQRALASRKSDMNSRATIRDFLKRYPELWSMIENLTDRVSREWFQAVCNDDEWQRTKIAQELAEFKQSLGDATSSRAERLLIDQLTSLWMAERHFSCGILDDNVSSAVILTRIRQWNTLQIMMQRTMMTLQKFRQQQAPANNPPSIGA